MTSSAVAPVVSSAAAARFERVYAAFHARVLGLLRHRLASAWQSGVGGWDESGGGVSPEELAQETWLRVWRRWPELLVSAPDDQMVCTYALTVAHRLVIDQARYRQMRRRVGERSLSDDGWEVARQQIADAARDGQPEARTLASEALREALTVLRALPRAAETGDQLDTLVVAMATSATLAATAERLGVPISTIKMRENRLRQTLRAWRAETEVAQEAAGEPT